MASVSFFHHNPRLLNLERHGMEMTSKMIYRLQHSGGANWPTDVPTPEGPYFVYNQARQLFLGRSGRGPLHTPGIPTLCSTTSTME